MRPRLEDMTLREKIAQTGMIAPSELHKGVEECGGWAEYFQKYPFSGVYVNFSCRDTDGQPFDHPLKLGEKLRDASMKAKIPLLVTCDEESGCNEFFEQLHAISTNLSLGAAGKGELAYWRSYYWAKEVRSFGGNWVFGPVVDLAREFFTAHTIRYFGSDPDLTRELIPYVIKGIHDAGLADCVKHYPGAHTTDYRDTHYSTGSSTLSKEEWYATDYRVYEAAVKAGTSAIMTSHAAFPAFDPSFARGRAPRPATASKPIMDVIRKELNYDGIIITDAVSMKGLAAAFEHEDIYIECFNAGNDIILFCRNDYIDVMEKAVKDGRVSEEQINRSCQRVLDLKEKLGLFDEVPVPVMPTEEDTKALEQACYNVAKHAITLVNNFDNMIPFDPKKVKKVGIIKLSPSERFEQNLHYLVEAFESRGIEVELLLYGGKKDDLQRLSETCDIIVYACYMAPADPKGMPFYSRPEEMNTLFNSLSYGASKTVVVSFGIPSIYYNYFESADAYVNAYSMDPGTMKAFADGILGDFEFTGKSPVALKPEFK